MARRPTGAALPGPGPGTVARPPNADIALLAVVVGAVSTSGPLIAATAAPALAVAFWRNMFATAALAPFALSRARAELARLRGKEWGLALGAGLLLGAHFATWVPSVRFTSVAASTALVTTQPVWAALIAKLRGGTLPARAWAGIAVAVLGAAAVTGADVSVSARALTGDGLALLGAILAAGYVSVGAEVRRSVSTISYTSICYATAALLLLVVGLAAGIRFNGFPASAWLKILALTLGAQFLGHSVVNRVLRTTSPTIVSLAILFEAPGASLIAALWLHQRPPVLVFFGLAVLLAGLALVVASVPGSPALPAE